MDKLLLTTCLATGLLVGAEVSAQQVTFPLQVNDGVELLGRKDQTTFLAETRSLSSSPGHATFSVLAATPSRPTQIAFYEAVCPSSVVTYRLLARSWGDSIAEVRQNYIFQPYYDGQPGDGQGPEWKQATDNTPPSIKARDVCVEQRLFGDPEANN